MIFSNIHRVGLKALLCLLLSATGFFVYAGNNNACYKSILADNDSIAKALKKASNREARKATLFSTVLPGAGQVYNKKYWKVPVIYGAFAGLGYLGINNHKLYSDYKNALSIRYDNDASTIDAFPKYTDENLVALKKQYKKRRDFCFIGIAGIYLLNIIDANVDGHLRKFNENMDEKIALQIKPCSDVVYTLNKPVYYSGLQVKFRF